MQEHQQNFERGSAEIKALAPRMPTTYLRRFFAEKEIPEVHWELEDEGGTTHFISNTVVVEAITGVGAAEAARLAAQLRRIDFANGDVNDFLKHLAGALINRGAR